MSGFGYACAVALAAVFVRAGVAKGLRPRETVAGFAALGVPNPAVTARVVPVAELVLAAMLLSNPRPGGVAALVLLAAFSALLTGAVRRGVTVGCNCFGAARVEPVSGVDLLRNGLLALLAAAALLAPRPRVPGVGAITVAVVLFGGGIAALRGARRGQRRP